MHLNIQLHNRVAGQIDEDPISERSGAGNKCFPLTKSRDSPGLIGCNGVCECPIPWTCVVNLQVCSWRQGSWNVGRRGSPVDVECESRGRVIPVPPKKSYPNGYNRNNDHDGWQELPCSSPSNRVAKFHRIDPPCRLPSLPCFAAMKSTVTISKIGRMPSGNKGIGVLAESLMAAPTATQLPLEPVLNEIVLELPELPKL